jgi:topoisomerase-4 subunit A
MDEEEQQEIQSQTIKTDVTHVSDMYSEWFMDYASYVILERAVPHLNDGLKPVQRRILHSMKDLDDGRYNKVANLIGHTMKYHPHGDASIGDALVQIGQKELLIDTQGNWGNVFTGDSSAAPRYIEARLTKFALDVAFNAKTTIWALSYDGRNKEPVTLPMKFPMLLAQGVEGIAVGLSTKVMPHNFNELLDASIDVLRGKETHLIPDFPTGGLIDASDYNRGHRGGKIRVRAKIEVVKKNLLKIVEIPFNTTTTSLIDSILSANEKQKIKIQRVDDNTAENVEIMVQFPPSSGYSSEQSIQALYKFTDCEVSISPNACVIHDEKPVFTNVDELLKLSTFETKGLLQRELEIRLSELEEKWHFASLEKIFIEKRIYRRIEEEETWEGVIATVERGLDPYRKLFKRAIVHEDLLRLLEIRIKRISKFNSFQAEEQIRGFEDEIEEVKNDLAHLTKFTIRYFKRIKKQYGSGRDRKTIVDTFSNISAAAVAMSNAVLYLNRQDGFAGYGLKKDIEIEKCSTLDDIVVFRRNGTMFVSKIQEKSFIGKNSLYVAVFRKEVKRTYSLIYRDGKNGTVYGKRFQVSGITRDREYELSKGTPGTRVLFFAWHEDDRVADKLLIHLDSELKLRKLILEFDFSSLAIKGRGSIGNIITKHKVSKIVRAPKVDSNQELLVKDSSILSSKSNNPNFNDKPSEQSLLDLE